MLREDPDVQRLIAGGAAAAHWSREWTFVSDDPHKVAATRSASSSRRCWRRWRRRCARPAASCTLISPYFVPGPSGTQGLLEVAATGGDVRILTNSLAATDVAAVHSGYARYREDLLEGGVKLWELRPTSDHAFALQPGRFVRVQPAYQGAGDRRSPGIRRLLQPRSALDLAQHRAGRAGLASAAGTGTGAGLRAAYPGRLAWKVQQVDGGLQWSDGTQTWTSDPDATMGRRMQVWLVRLLPVQSQL